MTFAPQASIDHAALRHNLQKVRQTAPQSRIWAVIKANAYGHGMQAVAKALREADGFAVARLEEALRLRQLRCRKPLLILEGVFDLVDARAAVEADCQLTIHQVEQIELLERLAIGRSAPVWLKVDTGMHRLGFHPMEVASVAQRLRDCPGVSELNLMTHLANANDRSDAYTRWQCEVFDQLPLDLFDKQSIANSAGLMGYPYALRDWVRPGIMLYGVSPFLGSTGIEEQLQPVMSFSARVIALNRCNAGDRVGYGGSYTCPVDMPVAVVGVGYGDGYPRHVNRGTPVLIRGQRLPIVGRVSMDMLCVDVSRLAAIEVGEAVTLWGRGLPVEEVAEAAGTIAYELLCGISARVEFVQQNMLTGTSHGSGR